MNGVVARVTFDDRVEYDTYEGGAGSKVDGTTDYIAWSKGVDYMNTVISVKDRVLFPTALDEHLKSHGLSLDMFMIFENGRLTGNRYENGDSNEITADEVRELNDQGIQTYIADYDIYITLLPEEREPNKTELHELLPSLEDYDD